MAPILLLMMVTELQEIPPIHQETSMVYDRAGNTPGHINLGNDVTANVNDASGYAKGNHYSGQKQLPDS